jgi:hypothetical protein
MLSIAWFGSYFLYQVYFVNLQEARYLFPIFPVLYYWIALGACFVTAKLSSDFVRGKLRLALQLFFCVIVCFMPTKLALAELLHFRHPLYTADIPLRVSQYAQNLAGANRIFWIGSFYPLSSATSASELEDSYAYHGYVYHLYKHVVEFYTERKIIHLANVGFVSQDEPADSLFVGPGLLESVREGDVFIIEKDDSTTSERRSRLIVQRVRVLRYAPAPSPEPGKQFFVSPDAPGTHIEGSVQAQGYTFFGHGLPDGLYELYVDLPQFDFPIQFAIVRAMNGKFKVAEEELKAPAPFRQVSLLYFDQARSF